MRPWKLYVSDVLQLVEFSIRITKWRKSVQLQKSRLRKIEWRDKLKAAAKEKDSAAICKIKKNRESARRRAEDRRKRVKRKQKCGRVKGTKRRRIKDIQESGVGRSILKKIRWRKKLKAAAKEKNSTAICKIKKIRKSAGRRAEERRKKVQLKQICARAKGTKRRTKRTYKTLEEVELQSEKRA